MDPAQAHGPVSRPVSDQGHDDSVLPFAVEPLDVRGRVVRLGASVDHILSQHNYPAPVARLVGEAAALTVLLGSSLKLKGGFQLQTRSDGPIDMLVVDFDAPDRLRAFARYDAERLARAMVNCRANCSARAISPSRSIRAMRCPAIRGWSPCKGRGWKKPRTNISASPSRSRRGCALRSPKA